MQSSCWHAMTLPVLPPHVQVSQVRKAAAEQQQRDLALQREHLAASEQQAIDKAAAAAAVEREAALTAQANRLAEERKR